MTLARALEVLESGASSLAAGAKAGESLNELRNGALQTLAKGLDLLRDNFEEAINVNIGAIGNSAAASSSFVAPYPCRIVRASVASQAAVTGDPLLTINNRSKAGAANKNVLAAANYDMAGQTAANEATALSLSATAANVECAAGDVVSATVTCDGNDLISNAALTFVIRPL